MRVFVCESRGTAGSWSYYPGEVLSHEELVLGRDADERTIGALTRRVVLTEITDPAEVDALGEALSAEKRARVLEVLALPAFEFIPEPIDLGGPSDEVIETFVEPANGDEPARRRRR
jgi:hypothetical protein